jgi:hypothetical protein
MLNKSSCLAAALGVTEFITSIAMVLVTHCCATQVRLGCSTNPPSVTTEVAAKHELLLKKQSLFPILVNECSWGSDFIKYLNFYLFPCKIIAT